jgi:heme-degrading monooxygenase HmoA
MNPKEPYYAVIFTSTRTPVEEGYDGASRRMVELAATQPGFLGVESARDSGVGITVSYWESLDAIAGWKRHVEHLEVQAKGKSTWYEQFHVRIARVEREYEFLRAD